MQTWVSWLSLNFLSLEPVHPAETDHNFSVWVSGCRPYGWRVQPTEVVLPVRMLQCRWCRRRVVLLCSALCPAIWYRLFYAGIPSHTHTHTHTQPYYGPFTGLPRWAVARRNLLDFMVPGKITEAETPTIRQGATPSGLISDPGPSSCLFLRRIHFLPQASHFILAWDRHVNELGVHLCYAICYFWSVILKGRHCVW